MWLDGLSAHGAGPELSLGTTTTATGEILDPFGHKASIPPEPSVCRYRCTHSQGFVFFCRVWFNASSTGFTESEIHFAMNTKEVFLPFEEDVWEKEVLPSPGCRGAYLSNPQRAPLMPPTPPTPPQHCLTRAGLSFLCVGFTALHLPSRSTAWPSLLSYLIYIY